MQDPDLHPSTALSQSSPRARLLTWPTKIPALTSIIVRLRWPRKEVGTRSRIRTTIQYLLDVGDEPVQELRVIEQVATCDPHRPLQLRARVDGQGERQRDR